MSLIRRRLSQAARDNFSFLAALIAAALLLTPVFNTAQAQDDPDPWCDVEIYDALFVNGDPQPLNYMEWDGEEIEPLNVVGGYGFEYLDRTDDTPTINVLAGGTYEVFLICGGNTIDGDGTINGYNNDVKIYLDIDDDKEFEETEVIFSGQDQMSFTGYVTIPAGQAFDNDWGEKRMRVVTDYWGINLGAENLDFIFGCPGDRNGLGMDLNSIAGQVRDYTMNITPGNDARAVAIRTSPSLFGPNDPVEIQVQIENLTPNPLRSCTVLWSLDMTGDPDPGTWNSFTWVAQGGEELGVNETTWVTVTTDQVLPYKTPLGLYEVRAATYRPNGVDDEGNTSDEAPATFLGPSLVGDRNYTVYGPGADFRSMEDAVQYLNNGILGEGPVDFLLNPLPGEQESYEEHLVLNDFPRDDNAVTFRSVTGDPNDVILEYTPDDYFENFLWQINGADFLTFEGIGFVVNQGYEEDGEGGMIPNGFASIFELNECMDVFFENCFFNGVMTHDESGDYSIFELNDCSAIGYDMCDFNYGSYGVEAMSFDNPTVLAAFESDFSGQSFAGIELIEFADLEDDVAGIIVDECSFTSNNYAGETFDPIFGVSTLGAKVEIFESEFLGIAGVNDGEGSYGNAIDLFMCDIDFADRVEGCYFETMNAGGIVSDDNGMLMAIGNTFDVQSDGSDDFFAVYGYMLPYGSMIHENQIATRNSFGVALEESDGFVFYNDITTIGDYPIGVAGVYADGFSGVVADNMIIGENTEGVRFFNGMGGDVVYNSVGVNSDVTLTAFLGGNYNVGRNIFANLMNGPVIMGEDYFDLRSDYNNIYAAGNPNALADWQAESGDDMNSSNAALAFQSNTNLHLLQFDFAIVQNKPFFETEDYQEMFETYDIDGDRRKEGVYIYGADHITPIIVIDKQPDEIISCVGEENHMLDITAHATLGDEAVYQWLKDDKEIPGANDAIYNFMDPMNFNHSGVYQCRVDSRTGAAETVYSQEILVYVLTAPKITREPQSQIVEEGGTIVFDMEAHIYGDKMEDPFYEPNYQWYMNDMDTPVQNNDKYAGAMSSILSIRGVEADDYNNVYFCHVTGYCGDATTQEVAPLAPPMVEILTPPADLEICDNAEGMFEVEAQFTGGGDYLTYQWKFNGDPIVDDNMFDGAETETLTVSNPTVDWEGEFSVEVTVYPGGDMQEAGPAMLDVKESPMIESVTEDQEVEAGRSFTLEVTASGEAPLSYQWSKDGMDMTGETASTFSVASATVSDAGEYACTVTNECGEAVAGPIMVTVTQLNFSSVDEAEAGGYLLAQNTPNPFKDQTTITYVVPESSHVRLVVTDMYGREVAVLVDDFVAAGAREVTFDSKGLASGVYYCVLTAEGYNISRKMSVVK